MGSFILGLLAVCFGIPVASYLAAPYPIQLAIKIVWKIYVISAATWLAWMMLSPLVIPVLNYFNITYKCFIG